MKTLLKFARRVDDSWQGDLIATIGLFLLGYFVWIIGSAVGQ